MPGAAAPGTTGLFSTCSPRDQGLTRTAQTALPPRLLPPLCLNPGALFLSPRPRVCLQQLSGQPAGACPATAEPEALARALPHLRSHGFTSCEAAAQPPPRARRRLKSAMP